MARSLHITTLDVAKKAGVGHSTVKNILNRNQSKRYSEKTCERVRAAAQEIGYQAYLTAKAIKQPLRNIAFLASGTASLDAPFMQEIQKGFNKAANEQGYLVMSTEPSHSLITPDDYHKEWDEKTETMIELVKGKILDGLLIDGSNFGNPHLQLLQKAQVPFVLINSPLLTEIYELSDVKTEGYIKYLTEVFPKMHCVSAEQIKGGYLAGEYLLNHGHRRIALLTPVISKEPIYYTSPLYRSRIRGYNKAHENAGVTPDPAMIFELQTEREKIVQVIDKILELPNLPTAIFAIDDSIAAVAMNYLQAKGFKVPQDISIIGYGNLPLVSSVFPKLTTIDVAWSKIGRLAVEMLISLLSKKTERTESEGVQEHHFNTVTPKLLEGESVASL